MASRYACANCGSAGARDGLEGSIRLACVLLSAMATWSVALAQSPGSPPTILSVTASPERVMASSGTVDFSCSAIDEDCLADGTTDNDMLVFVWFHPVMDEPEVGTDKWGHDWNWCAADSPGVYQFTVDIDDQPTVCEDGFGVIDSASVTVTVTSVGLKSVTFSGSGYHAVVSDTGTATTAPHWQDSSTPLDGDADEPGDGDKKLPVCFVRDSTMIVSATFEISPAGGTPVLIRGDGPSGQGGSMDICATSVASTTTTTLPATPATRKFRDEIDYYGPLTIQWEASLDGGTTWHSVAASQNEVYITWGTPTTTTYHTLLDIGCKRQGDGLGGSDAATRTAVVAAIWNEFPGRSVKRVPPNDADAMTYYSAALPPFDAADLLSGGDGRCEAWAGLFRDAIKVQGIAANMSVIAPYDTVFWTALGFDVFASLDGQGPTDPPSQRSFTNHAVVEYGGTIYDPSYGKSFTAAGATSALAAWENAALETLGRRPTTPPTTPYLHPHTVGTNEDTTITPLP